ncbi:hypothetical protein IG631_21280 [Alternaria alternata]|nr:hypothetical protein IG631_21280 [Alternaria alternata]
MLNTMIQRRSRIRATVSVPRVGRSNRYSASKHGRKARGQPCNACRRPALLHALYFSYPTSRPLVRPSLKLLHPRFAQFACDERPGPLPQEHHLPPASRKIGTASMLAIPNISR